MPRKTVADYPGEFRSALILMFESPGFKPILGFWSKPMAVSRRHLFYRFLKAFREEARSTNTGVRERLEKLMPGLREPHGHSVIAIIGQEARGYYLELEMTQIQLLSKDELGQPKQRPMLAAQDGQLITRSFTTSDPIYEDLKAKAMAPGASLADFKAMSDYGREHGLSIKPDDPNSVLDKI